MVFSLFLSKRTFSSCVSFRADYSHAVIGAGVVGLAIAAKLAENPSNSIVLIERHDSVGTETSARNSEVIHAGLYYPPDSLKARLCVRGKELIYKVSSKYNIGHKQCGKWVVAQTEKEEEYLLHLEKNAKELNVPVEFLSIEKAKLQEPDVLARSGILNSPSTGIVSAHDLMTYLQGVMESNGNSDLALGTTVKDINRENNGEYSILCSPTLKESSSSSSSSFSSDEENFSFTSEVLINSGGLGACNISNMLLPSERHVTPYYAKGNYFSYNSSSPRPKRLIYPCPAGLAGLGTHLTIDLGGRVRFGPDVEWITNPNDLNVSTDNKRLKSAIEAVKTYLPSVDVNSFVPDYAGIRPKLVGEGSGFKDFIIRQEKDFPGYINCLGIESPGLTSSMAIAEYVYKLL